MEEKHKPSKCPICNGTDITKHKLLEIHWLLAEETRIQRKIAAPNTLVYTEHYICNNCKYLMNFITEDFQF